MCATQFVLIMAIKCQDSTKSCLKLVKIPCSTSPKYSRSWGPALEAEHEPFRVRPALASRPRLVGVDFTQLQHTILREWDRTRAGGES